MVAIILCIHYIYLKIYIVLHIVLLTYAHDTYANLQIPSGANGKLLKKGLAVAHQSLCYNEIMNIKDNYATEK